MSSRTAPAASMLPTGVVTLVLTDVEGSTRLWEKYPAQMREAAARHDEIIVGMVSHAGGAFPKDQGEGDSFVAAFPRPSVAVDCALAIQLAMSAEHWPADIKIRIRIGVHTGEAELAGQNYRGPVVIRAARLRDLAHGGQTLLSKSTYDFVRERAPEGSSFKDLGSHHLKDLSQPEHVLQLEHPDLPESFPPLRSLQPAGNNLPFQLTSFIGRTGEIASLKELLRSERLVTITGVGGAGKTRLALEVARGMLDEYDDGVWFVPLAGIREPDLVAEAVASELRISEQPRDPIVETLAQELAPRQTLLILDNCEHLVDAVAGLADKILRTCPAVTITATSREPLGVAGEASFRVPPLSVPDAYPPGASVAEFDAVRLFVQRAVLRNPEFELSPANGAAIAEICRRLEGIPLAIELAASQMAVLSVEQILHRLDDRLRILARGDRGAPRRHRSLRAAIDWSHDLLNEDERILLRRISVFRGGFTLEAAEQVCCTDELPDSEVLDHLSSLVDKSLVAAREVAGWGRYSLHEATRQYASEKLSDSGEAADARRRHLEWCAVFAEEAESRREGPESDWLDRLDREHDNFRAALDWGLTEGDAAVALRLAAGLGAFWYIRGHHSEGRRWLEPAISRGGDSSPLLKAKALNHVGRLLRAQGEHVVAHRLHEQSLELHRKLDDRPGIGWTSLLLGAVAQDQGDIAAARRYFEDALSIFRELGDARRTAQTLHALGGAVQAEGDFDKARTIREEELALAREAGDRWSIAVATHDLGALLLELGDRDSAAPMFDEALQIFKELDGKWGIAWSLFMKGQVELESDPDRARILYQEALSIFSEIGNARGIGQTLQALGEVAHAASQFEHAAALYREALLLMKQHGERLVIAGQLDRLAKLAGDKGEWPRAATLFAASDSLHEALNYVRSPVDLAEHDSDLVAVRDALSPEAFEQAWRIGSAMTIAGAIEFGLEGL